MKININEGTKLTLNIYETRQEGNLEDLRNNECSDVKKNMNGLNR